MHCPDSTVYTTADHIIGVCDKWDSKVYGHGICDYFEPIFSNSVWEYRRPSLENINIS